MWQLVASLSHRNSARRPRRATMTSDSVFDEGPARSALEAADQARASGRRAGSRWAVRSLLGFGAVSAGSVLAIWALSPWLPQAWWGICYAALAVLFGFWIRRQPVRALPRRTLIATIVAWAVVFGTTMAVAIDHPVAYPIGA